jgi:phosphoribosylformylglycinamidine synthase PurS subunit
MTIRVHVRIVPRSGLLDPQGQAIEHALSALGFSGVGDVRVGKAIELSIDAATPEAAEAAARDMCQRLLANPVTEDFLIQADDA